MKLKTEEIISLENENKDKYQISNEEYEILKTNQERLNNLNEDLKSKKISFKEYNKEILKIEENLPNNFNILMNSNNKLEICIKAKLKIEFMNKTQLLNELKINQDIKKYGYYISWTESEAGWGQRPDGISLYKSAEDGIKHIKEYWDKMPKNTPHEYSRPDFETPKLIEISNSLFEALISKEIIHLNVNDPKRLKDFDASSMLKKYKP